MDARSQSLTRTAKPPVLRQGGPLQRNCACGQHTITGGECAACGEKRKAALQRSAIGRDPGNRNVDGVPPIVNDVLRSPGQPLDAATRAFFEPRFGRDFTRVPVRSTQLSSSRLSIGPADDPYEREAHRMAFALVQAPEPHGLDTDVAGRDLSHVRVHMGPQAAASAESINAKAYTVGRDIVFGSGQYAPHTSAGRQLLAHELTHVMQQTVLGAPPSVQRLTAKEKIENLKSKRLKNDARLQRAFDNSPAMRKDEVSEGVKTLQRALHDLGYPMPISFKDGDADGIFGDETLDTVKQFQADQGLPPPYGVVGRDTLRKLDEIYSTVVTLKSIRFTSDHGPMVDNKASWDAAGPAFPKPDWQSTNPDGKSGPISHTKNQAVTVELTVDLAPETATGVPVTLKGSSSLSFLSFNTAGTMSGGKDQTVTATSAATIPDNIDNQFVKQTIDWSANVAGEDQALTQSLDHDVFVTYGKPEGGVTYKRMAKATELTKGFGNNPHDIVSGEMRRFPSYNLKRGYPGNIWPLADAIPASAECQSIVRFVQAVNKMVGLPGTASGIAVYASPSSPDTPIIATLLESGGATGSISDFPPNSKTGDRAFLFDSGDNANNYEAALEFEFGDKLFYPGGVPGGIGLKTTLNVLHSFKKMSWSKWDPVSNQWKPTKLIHCYHPPC